MFASLRQLRYAPEFRIEAGAWPEDLEELLRQLVNCKPPAAPAGNDEETEAKFLKLLANVGTGLWRARQKMVKPGTTQPLEEMRRAYRHVESIWDALAQAGISIQDHADKPFDAGLSLKVVSYQPTPGLTRDRIIETIKPTIYFNDRHIQMGEVIVGTPEAQATAPQGNNAPAA